MKTSARRLILSGLAVVLLAACTASPGGARPTETPGAAGGGTPGATGGGTPSPDQPIATTPPNDGSAPVEPNPTIVVPKPGRLQVHPVDAATIEPRVVGRRVVVKLTWWSGVEPCSVLDSVGVARSGNLIALTIREGADRLDVACIEIAMLKATIVDLGELAPGIYTISAGALAEPVRVVVS